MTDLAASSDRDAVLRSYLLGNLTTEEAEEIDEQVVTDADLHAELQATADDLIHAYLANALNAHERERFESQFLASPRRRERVAFMRSLLSTVGRERAAQAAGPHRPRGLVGMLPWAAVLAISLTASGWSLLEKRWSDEALSAATVREGALRAELADRKRRIEALEARTALDASDVETWRLRATVERGPGQADAFTASRPWVRLRVPLEHDLQVAAYRAVLHARDGREILRIGGLRQTSDRMGGLPDATGAEGRTLDVMVPAGLLEPGTYLLSIQQDTPGTSDELTAATFLVR